MTKQIPNLNHKGSGQEQSVKENDLSGTDLESPLTEENEELEGMVNEDDELLIAWLDRELLGEERARFERRLAESPELRKKMEELRETWKMLDQLQTEPPGPKFTQTTMKMVALDARKELRQREGVSRKIRWGLWSFFILLFISSLLAGHFIVSSFLSDSRLQITKDREIILYLDSLEAVEPFDFLIQLKDSRIFNKPVLSSMNTFGREKTFTASYYARLKALSLPQLQEEPEFHRLLFKYDNLSRARKKELRELYRRIVSSPDKEDLIRTMENYNEWLRSDVHEMERDLLYSLSGEKRLEHIQKLLATARRRTDYRNRLQDRPENRLTGNERPNFPKAGAGRGADAKNPPPGREGQVNRFQKNLPEPLRKENLTPLFKEFSRFRTERQTTLNGKPKQGPHDAGFFNLINDFIKSRPLEEWLTYLSPKAQKYMEDLSEKEQARILGLLLSMEMFKREGLQKRGDARGVPQKKANPPERNRTGYGSREGFRDISFPNNGKTPPGPIPPFLNESTKELAEVLKKLPKEQQDKLLRLPGEEMYAHLLFLHWGVSTKRDREAAAPIVPRRIAPEGKSEKYPSRPKPDSFPPQHK